MSVYDDYKKEIKKYIVDNKTLIEETKRQANGTLFPQHILWAKEVCNELKTKDAKTVTIDENFYFTEKLVNRLMLFAYLKGQHKIDEKCYKKGWNDCRINIQNKLGYSSSED